MRNKLKIVFSKNIKLEKKVISSITIFILIFATTISLILILSLRRYMISNTAQNVINYSNNIAQEYNTLFNHYQKTGIVLNNSIKRRVVTIEHQPFLLSDPRTIKRAINGSIRIDDGISGAFLAKDSKLSDNLLKYFFFSKRTFEVLGPIAKAHFFNFYFITEENFIRITPKDWALQIEADHNFGNDVFYKIANPENNPQRSPKWTPLYYDSIWKRWMTSLIIPIYDEDDFIGITGSDIFLDTIFKNIEELNNKTGIYKAILFDSNANLLVYPKYKDEILTSTAEMNTLLNLSDLEDSFVSKIIASATPQNIISNKISSFKYLTKTYYSSSKKIPAMDWYICVYVDRSEIFSNLNYLIILIFGISLILGLIIIAVLRLFARKFVLNRISKLNQKVTKIAAGDLTSQVEVINNDEIGILEAAFANMQKSLINQFEELKNNEIELKEKEKKYRSLIESTSEGFWLVNLEQKTIDVNQSLCNMLGYSQNELIGKNPQDFVDADNRKIFKENMSKMTTTLHRAYEISLRKKDGINISTIFNSTTLVDKNGKTLGAFAFVTDNSKYKLAEKEIKKKSVELEKQLENSEKHRVANLVILKDLNKTTKNLKSEISERKQAEKELKKRLNELEIFNDATVNREMRIIELRKEVNDILIELGKEKKYEIVE